MSENDSIINDFIKPFYTPPEKNENYGGEERRLRARISVRWSATLDDFIKKQSCIVTNVSSKGARIVTKNDIGVGAHVELSIEANINGCDLVIPVAGEAKNILIDGDVFIGIEFMRVDPVSAEILDAFTSS